MNTLILRPYQGEQDLPAIAELLNTCALADNMVDAQTSVDELRTEFNSPSVKLDRDLRLWEDSDGRLIGFASMWIPEASETNEGVLWFKVHPTARDRGLEKEMIAWGESVMRQVGAERQVSVSLHASARMTQSDRIALLEQQGFQPIRYFQRMERSLEDPIPQPEFPSGFTLAQMGGVADAKAWVEMFNQSFIDHWNHHEFKLEECIYWLEHDPKYDPTLDLIAIAPDGMFAAFCYSEIDPESNDRIGRLEGWVNLLGTRRGYRRLGLGRAMLLSGLHRLKAAGMTVALLGVDSENPSGARQLYESVGFQQVLTNIVFAKPVSCK